MLKRLFISMLATIAAVVGLSTLTTSAAHADQRPCVSYREYQNIRWTWPPATKAKVHSHFDTGGYFVEGDPYWVTNRDITRAYRKCGEWGRGYVYVWFDNYYYDSYDNKMRVYAMTRNTRAFNYGNWTQVQ